MGYTGRGARDGRLAVPAVLGHLTAVVSTETIRDTLRGLADPEQAAGRLIEAANARGGPDNVSCVVADIIPLVWHVTG